MDSPYFFEIFNKHMFEKCQIKKQFFKVYFLLLILLFMINLYFLKLLMHFQGIEMGYYELSYKTGFSSFLSFSIMTEQYNIAIASLLFQLAARNQDQVARAILCLSKVHQQLKSFGNDYKKSWKIVTERVQELLAILNVPK